MIFIEDFETLLRLRLLTAFAGLFTMFLSLLYELDQEITSICVYFDYCWLRMNPSGSAARIYNLVDVKGIAGLNRLGAFICSLFVPNIVPHSARA